MLLTGGAPGILVMRLDIRIGGRLLGIRRPIPLLSSLVIDHHVVGLTGIPTVGWRLFRQSQAALGRGGASEVLAACGVRLRCHRGICYLCPGLRRLLRLVRFGGYRHICNVLRGHRGHRVETHARPGYRGLLLLCGLVIPLPLLLGPLKLLQALHDGAIRQALLMLDCSDPRAADIVPRCARFVLVLRRVQSELIARTPAIASG